MIIWRCVNELLSVECDDIMVWCIFSFTWIVGNYMKLLNCDKFPLIAIKYMSIDGVIVIECIYVKWWVDVGELLLNMCMLCRMFMHSYLWDIYIQLRWLWCAVWIMGWRPRRCWWRHRMHLEVVSRNISCCGMSPSCSNTWCLMWMVIDILWCCELLRWRVFWNWMLLLLSEA